MNLYDLTRGNYRVRRTVSYPEFPKSQVVFDTEVTAAGAEWSTKIMVSGTYDGPTDIVAVKDYQVAWTTDGKSLFEKGTATLELSSGGSVRSVWSSSIVADKPRFARFPREGETINVTYSPFKIEGNKMSYEWEGTVGATVHGTPSAPGS
jgi:hypothetical protein